MDSMNSTMDFNQTVNGWLAKLTQAPLAPTLTITSGLHRGASLELTADRYLLGSDDDCDIVLHDSPVALRHCLLTRDWSGFVVNDLRCDPQRVIAPAKVDYDRGAIEARYDIGGVMLTLRHAPQRPVESIPDPAQGAGSLQIFGVRVSLLVAMAAVGITAILAALAWGHRVVASLPETGSPGLAAANEALAAQHFGSVQFTAGAHGELQVRGVVSDAGQKERLQQWLRGNSYGAVRVNVQSGSELVDQVRRALDDASLRIGLRENRIYIEGTTSRTVMADRIHALASDLRGTIGVEERVTYIDAADLPGGVGPLPVSVRSVMSGNPGYFLTDSGARYFVGALLPDGAEVLAIDPDEIRLRRDGKVLAYKLQ